MPRTPLTPVKPKLNEAQQMLPYGVNTGDGCFIPRQGSSTFLIVRTMQTSTTVTVQAGDSKAGAFASGGVPLVITVPLHETRIIQLESAKYLQQGGVFHVNFSNASEVIAYSFYL